MKVDPKFIFLAVAMVVTGSINTITTKYADNTYSKGIDGTVRQFDHPFFQAAGMFLGELLCLLAFYSIQLKNHCQDQPVQKTTFNPLIFVLPACCDMTATSLMYLGLTYTYASVFQMLRGSVIIFTGIFSMIFLKKRLGAHHWSGMLLVLGGLAFVGLASIFSPGTASADASHPLLGDILIIAAQLVVAVQMVVEEKFITKFNVPPLQVVGFEGLFGLSILSCVIWIMYYIPGSSAGNHFENAPDAFVQMKNSDVVTGNIIGNILSIAFFNYFGISITKYSSATTRMVMDSIRTLTIWVYSLIVHWQSFQYFQLIGFSLLIAGTCIYNEVFVIPFLGAVKVDGRWVYKTNIKEDVSENKPLIQVKSREKSIDLLV